MSNGRRIRRKVWSNGDSPEARAVAEGMARRAVEAHEVAWDSLNRTGRRVVRQCAEAIRKTHGEAW